MKLVSTLFLLIALFSSTVLAEGGNMGTGGRGVNSDIKTTVKGGMTTEDGDPPPPPPPCAPTPESACDDGNMGTGGRSAVMDFIQKYLISIFG